MTDVVVDSSAVVALLVDSGPTGDWVAEQGRGRKLAGPDLIAFETANVLRRLFLSGQISDEIATLDHADLLDLDVAAWPYLTLAQHVWELRTNITVYDAAYVALARLLQVPLLTLDPRLAHSGVTGCEIRCPAR